MQKKIKTTILLIIWGALLVIGMGRLNLYSNTPGEKAIPSKTWPGQSALVRDTHLPTLVIFSHPHCPCSIATIGELERLMPYLKDRVQTLVIFFRPKESTPEWIEGSIWKKVKSLPGVKLTDDVGGMEALKFDAKTSGQTYLYSVDGKLVFSGGITPERGHMGDSKGREAILAYVQTMKPLINESEVFGCSLNKTDRKISSNDKP